MKVIDEIITKLQELNKLTYLDLSDVGDAIGRVVEANTKVQMGFEREDFLNGLDHGLNFEQDKAAAEALMETKER